MTEFKLGRLVGLNLSSVPSVFVGTVLLWIALCGIAIGLFGFPFGVAAVLAFIATGLHWASETLHQLGHAWAARKTGNPMIGIRYWGVLSTSVYPADEKILPATIHIRRALGGPAGSLVVTVAAFVILFALDATNVGGIVWLLALFFFLENLSVFFFGALLPLGFTDGSTLLRWRGKK